MGRALHSSLMTSCGPRPMALLAEDAAVLPWLDLAGGDQTSLDKGLRSCINNQLIVRHRGSVGSAMATSVQARSPVAGGSIGGRVLWSFALSPSWNELSKVGCSDGTDQLMDKLQQMLNGLELSPSPFTGISGGMSGWG